MRTQLAKRLAMNRFPESILVELEPDADVPVEKLLVGLTLRRGERDYFSTLAGLTDSEGRIAIRWADIESDYRANQRLFPMDYRLELGECDGLLIDLGGGSDFETQRASALAAPVLSDEARQHWSAARNTGVASTRLAVVRGEAVVTVRLRARRIGLP